MAGRWASLPLPRHCCCRIPTNTHEILGSYSVTQHKRVLCHILVTFEWIYSYSRLPFWNATHSSPISCAYFGSPSRSLLLFLAFLMLRLASNYTLTLHSQWHKFLSTKDKRWSARMESEREMHVFSWRREHAVGWRSWLCRVLCDTIPCNLKLDKDAERKIPSEIATTNFVGYIF